jgi:beta-lactamase regulating signal transducer with metallopeptidase domain
VSALVRRASAWSAWLAFGLIMAAHVGLAVLAVIEVVMLGWLTSTWFDLVAVSVVLASAAAGLTAAAWVAARAVRGSRTLSRLARSSRAPCPSRIMAAAAGLGPGPDIEVVRADEPFAVTYGLMRPRILVSTGLAEALSVKGIAAVLAHERHHVRHRDPLRLLAVRLAAAYGCWLPAAAWLARNLALRRELSADLAAARRTSRADLAAALLRLASLPACPALAAARSAADERRSLEARVTQLEGSQPRRTRPAMGRIVASGGTIALVTAACMCCAALSQALPGGLL